MRRAIFIEFPGAGDRLFSTPRSSVKLFAIGLPDDVDLTITELHAKRFSEANAWSRPLKFPETQQQFILSPGEVMRVYKRYMTR